MTSLDTTPDTPTPTTTRGAATPWQAIARRASATSRRAEPYLQSAVLLAMRLVYGWFFAQAGWGKLMNLERTSGFFESLGLPAPMLMAGLVGTTELLGGVLLAAGAGTRAAAAALTGVMLTALATAHAEEAFASLSAFTEQAPYPFLVASLVLLAFGAGRLSIDGWLRARFARPRPEPSADRAD